MTSSEPPHRHHGGLDPLLQQARLPFLGSPPPGGWSTMPVAERLIQALERLIDLNEQTARLTALYRSNLQQESAGRNDADTRRRDEDLHRAPHDSRHLERY